MRVPNVARTGAEALGRVRATIGAAALATIQWWTSAAPGLAEGEPDGAGGALTAASGFSVPPPAARTCTTK